MLEKDKILTPLWFLIGIAIFAGIAWDGFQPAMETQMFLGASNNFTLILFLVALLTCGRLYTTGYLEDKYFVLGWSALLAWALFVISLTGMHFLPLIYWVMLAVLGGLLLRFRSLTKLGLLAKFNDYFFILMVAFTGLLSLSCAVHLMGDWPQRQIFLYVDGFANIRTFGETALLAWLAGLAFVFSNKRTPLAILVMLIAGTLMFWSGTRAAWVGAIVALAILTLTHRAFKPALLSLVLLGVSGASSLLLPLPGHEYGLVRAELLGRDVAAVTTEPTITQNGDITPSATGTGSTRMALWTWGAQQTLESPLTGHGPMRMMLMDRPERLKFAHLHNTPLDLAFWFGWPAAILILLAMLTGWAGLVKASWKHTEGASFWLAISTGLCVTSLFAGTLIFPITLLAAMMGLSIGRILIK